MPHYQFIGPFCRVVLLEILAGFPAHHDNIFRRKLPAILKESPRIIAEPANAKALFLCQVSHIAHDIGRCGDRQTSLHVREHARGEVGDCEPVIEDDEPNVTRAEYDIVFLAREVGEKLCMNRKGASKVLLELGAVRAAARNEKEPGRILLVELEDFNEEVNALRPAEVPSVHKHCLI